MTPEFFSSAYTTGFRLTFRLLRKYSATIDQAEEFTQAAWARGWECRAQLSEPSKLVVWVNTIGLNLLRNALRVRRLRGDPVEIQEWMAVTESKCESASDRDTILEACPPGKMRIAIDLHYLREYTCREAGEKLGEPASTFQVRLLRARQEIRKRLRIQDPPLKARAAGA